MLKTLTVSIVAAALVGAAPVAADAPTPARNKAPVAQQDGPISLSRAVQIAERATGGHVLDAELEHSRGRTYYEVDLVRGKTLHELHIDAYTGKVIRKATPTVNGYWARWFDADRLGKATKSRPLSEILARVERQTGGQTIEASFDVEAGQPRYELEISTRAGVTDLYVNPRTGERLSMVLDD